MKKTFSWIALYAFASSLAFSQGITDCPSLDLILLQPFNGANSVIEICNPSGEPIVLQYEQGSFPYYWCEEGITILDG